MLTDNFWPEFLHNLRLYLFVVANLAIVIGYGVLAAYVMPRIAVTLKRTRWGGIGFFTLCALTHLDQALHAVFEPHIRYGTIAAEWHMVAIHVLQAIAVLLFVSGLYVEFVSWGPWARDKDRDGK